MALALALQGLSFIAGITALVCFIMIVIKMFQNQQTGLGIASIVGVFLCGIGYLIALVVGWQNKNNWQLGKIMPIFTACLAVSILSSAGFVALTWQEALKQQQNVNSEFQSDFDMPDITIE